MDRLLHPGMRLMRRMGVTAKFGLVTVLLLLPLTIVVGTSFAESTGRLQAVDAERSGLRVAAPLVQLVVQLAQAQDAAARGLAPPPRLTAVDAVDAAVREAGPRLPIDAAWQDARRDVVALTRAATPHSAAAMADAAIRRCSAVLKTAADLSGLMMDPELDSYYMATSLVTTLPRLLVAAGAVPSTVTATGGPAEQRLEQRLEQRVGARTLADLADRLGRDLDTATAATSWPELDHRVRPDVAAVSAAVTQYAQEAEGAEPATGVTPFGSGSLAGASASLASGLSGSLDALLDRRHQELASSRDRPVLLALGALLVLGYLLVAVWRSTSQDVRALLEDISTISNGQQPRQPAMEGSDEFARMSRAMTITRDRLTSLLGSLRYQATHDELTALGNRTLFTDKIAEALAERGPGVAVVVADLDHFRDVNDSFGHAMGDRLLRAVGVRFHRACGRQNVVARLGSDEFGILLPAGGGEPAALDVVERLRAALHPPIDVDGRLLQVRATFGWRSRARTAGARASWSGTRTSPSRRRATPHPGRVTTARPPPASPSSNRGCTSARGTARSCPRSSSGRSTGASSSSSTSRSSTSRRRPCTASRRSRAGTTPSAAWCRRRCSCRSPRPPGRSCPSGGGCCASRRGSWPAGAPSSPTATR